MLTNLLFISTAVSLTGLVIVGWLLFDLRKKIKKILGGKTTELNLPQDLLRRITRAETKLEELEPSIKILEKIAKTSVQKVGFLRFNPFQNTGGDNSFVLVLLDRENNGIVLSSLYAREMARIYGKRIESGICKQVLSDEEKKVLEETINRN